jgi:ring-1,2-phenylacetyl-CoA epoxidase subunit PaaE
MRTTATFVAEGGITSAVALAARLMASEKDRLWFFYDDRAGDHPDELEQLLALKDRYLDRLSLGVVTARDADEAELLSGTLDGAKVQALSSRLLDAKAIDSFIVFGSDAFAADVRSALTALGVDSTRIHAERSHQTSGLRAPPETASAPNLNASATANANETQVSFVMDGRRRTFSMRTNDESILDAAERAGIELPYSCKAGVCATCRTKLLRGQVQMDENCALEDWELEQGFILACQSRATTPEVELTYDEK